MDYIIYNYFRDKKIVVKNINGEVIQHQKYDWIYFSKNDNVFLILKKYENYISIQNIINNKININIAIYSEYGISIKSDKRYIFAIDKYGKKIYVLKKDNLLIEKSFYGYSFIILKEYYAFVDETNKNIIITDKELKKIKEIIIGQDIHYIEERGNHLIYCNMTSDYFFIPYDTDEGEETEKIIFLDEETKKIVNFIYKYYENNDKEIKINNINIINNYIGVGVVFSHKITAFVQHQFIIFNRKNKKINIFY